MRAFTCLQLGLLLLGVSNVAALQAAAEAGVDSASEKRSQAAGNQTKSGLQPKAGAASQQKAKSTSVHAHGKHHEAKAEGKGHHKLALHAKGHAAAQHKAKAGAKGEHKSKAEGKGHKHVQHHTGKAEANGQHKSKADKAHATAKKQHAAKAEGKAHHKAKGKTQKE